MVSRLLLRSPPARSCFQAATAAQAESLRSLVLVGKWVMCRELRGCRQFLCFVAVLFSVLLQWDANSEIDLAGYKVYRDGELIATLPKAQTEYLDPSGGNIYFVRAFNLSGL
jgi:hypothetical protein